MKDERSERKRTREIGERSGGHLNRAVALGASDGERALRLRYLRLGLLERGVPRRVGLAERARLGVGFLPVLNGRVALLRSGLLLSPRQGQISTP